MEVMEIFKAISSKPLKSVRDVQEFEISYEMREDLRNRLPKITDESEIEDLNVQKECGDVVRAVLGEQLSNAIRYAVEHQCAAIIRNLPIDHDLPATPTESRIGVDRITCSVASNVGLHNLVSSSIASYLGENNDKALRHVIPHIKSAHEKSSHGSLLSFGMHVDNPHLPLSPEKDNSTAQCPRYLALMALRCDISVPTKVVFLDDVLGKLPEYVVSILKKPIYKLKWPDSFGEIYSEKPGPVLATDKDGICYSRFDKQNVIPLSEEAELSFSIFQAVAESEGLVKKVVLLPGDLIIFDNQRMVHARDGFSPKMNGCDRWLIRLFGINA